MSPICEIFTSLLHLQYNLNLPLEHIEKNCHIAGIHCEVLMPLIMGQVLGIEIMNTDQFACQYLSAASANIFGYTILTMPCHHGYFRMDFLVKHYKVECY